VTLPQPCSKNESRKTGLNETHRQFRGRQLVKLGSKEDYFGRRVKTPLFIIPSPLKRRDRRIALVQGKKTERSVIIPVGDGKIKGGVYGGKDAI